MLFLVVSTPRPERSSDAAKARQSFWPWISAYEKRGVCQHIYARVGRGAVAVFDVEDNDALHRILNEWADIIPAHFDTYPLIDTDAAKQMLAAQVTAKP
jgi:muconolactone delta-isomerase